MTTLLLDCGVFGERPGIVTYTRRHAFSYPASVTVHTVVVGDDRGEKVNIELDFFMKQRIAFQIEDDIDNWETPDTTPSELSEDMG